MRISDWSSDVCSSDLVQPWRAAERVHAQARVVGQRRQPGDKRRVAGLEQGVLDEAQAGFLDVPDAEFALSDAVDACLTEQLPEFGELAGVAAGDDQFHGVRGTTRSRGISAPAPRAGR